jgi:hypothetical protein
MIKKQNLRTWSRKGLEQDQVQNIRNLKDQNMVVKKQDNC